ncbi:MAG: GatB/YqeY domain-containing protein [Bacteroidales bacterium]
MSLAEKISSDLLAAMKVRDNVVLDALRAVKTAFTLARVDKGADSVLTSEEEIQVIRKLVKQRQESAEIYKQNNRTDLYEKEMTEVKILEKYLPAKISNEELILALRKIIEHVGATTPADLGKVMGAAMKELSGKADGSEISAMAKKLLGS